MTSTLKKRTVINIIWAGFGSIGSQAIHYVVLLVLAWILSPEEFGLIGIAMIFILFTQSITELGFGAAIIQHPDIGEPGLSTAFWANLGLGILLALMTYYAAVPITTFIGDVNAAPLLEALSVIFPIAAISVVPKALLEKNLSFRILTTRDFASEVAYGVVGIVMALLGYGVWSLVGAAIANRVFNTIAIFRIVSWRPKFSFNYDSFRNLLDFGGYAMVASVLNKAVANIDYFVVGRWLGTEALGYYTLAFQLSVVPERRLILVIQRVIFPTFSIVQDNIKKLTAGFIESLRYLYMILSPLTLFGIVLAPWFIRTLYGDKWQASILPMQILFIAGFFYGFEVVEMVYYAKGKPHLRIWIIGIRIVLFVFFAAMFGVSNGIVGIALSLTLSVAIAALVSIYIVVRFTLSNWKSILQPIWIAIRSALVAGFPVIVLLIMFREEIAGIPSWLIMISAGLVLVTLYLLTVLIFYPQLYGQLKAGFLQVIRK